MASEIEKNKNEPRTKTSLLIKSVIIYFILSVLSNNPYVFARAVIAIPIFCPCLFSSKTGIKSKLIQSVISAALGAVISTVFLCIAKCFSLPFIISSLCIGFTFLTAGLLTTHLLSQSKALKLNALVFFLLNIVVVFS